MSARGRYVLGWLLGWLLGLLWVRYERCSRARAMRAAYCQTIAAAGGLFTRTCPGCGGTHRQP